MALTLDCANASASADGSYRNDQCYLAGSYKQHPDPGAMTVLQRLSSDVAEGPTLAGTIDYAALASALAGVLTLAIMIWIAYAGRS